MKNRSIRYKFSFFLTLLLILVISLAGTGFSALPLYRRVVKDLEWRAQIIPVAAKLLSEAEELRFVFFKIDYRVKTKNRTPTPPLIYPDEVKQKEEFDSKLTDFRDSLDVYIRLMSERVDPEKPRGALQQEWTTLNEIRILFTSLESSTSFDDWMEQRNQAKNVEEKLHSLWVMVGNLPNYQLSELERSSNAFKGRYATMFFVVLLSGIISAALLVVLIRIGYSWIFQPLSVLIDGSRQIASGQFSFRIKLQTGDEMSELATAMNEMTDRFETIRNDLDQQVQLRSQEVVRNERLASVGFLAAGVAHEINNPLASIAMCAESLDRRILLKLESGDFQNNISQSDIDVVKKYLAMIQSEAFRCKEITGKLLDFARTEKSTREKTELNSLIMGMVEMIAHHGDYRDKEVRLNMPKKIYATVNPQEMKQVILNLLTNALDSIIPGGSVRIKLSEKDGFAQFKIEDNGCGMDPNVLDNVFEPFYTRKKQGHGTGLGLSITHRIVSDHDGRIEASSSGVGKGSTFTVEIPLENSRKETQKSAA